jgi:hypothetical protein
VLMCGEAVQESALMGAIGMQCKVGDCLYAAAPPPAPAPLPPPPRVNHPEALALAFVAAVFFAFVATVALFVRMDRRRTVRSLRAVTAAARDSNDEDDGSASCDSGHEMASFSQCAPSRAHALFRAARAHHASLHCAQQLSGRRGAAQGRRAIARAAAAAGGRARRRGCAG